MYVYMISYEITSSPCTLGITNEPLCGVHDASPKGLLSPLMPFRG